MICRRLSVQATFPLVGFVLLFLAGCGQSYEAEYQAAQQEIHELKVALSEAERKLKAADSDTRLKLLTLMRRIQNALQGTTVDRDRLKRYVEELQIHSDSYVQMASSDDTLAIASTFFAEKTALLLSQLNQSSAAYDKRYFECVAELETQENDSNRLNTMLCEVQADVARAKQKQQTEASQKTLLFIAEQLMQPGQGGIKTKTQLSRLYSDKFIEFENEN